MSDFWRFKTERRMCISLLDVKNEMINWKKPRDLAVIRVFYQGHFLCRVICAEFAGQHISLKEVIQARTQQRKRVRQGIKDRLSVVEQIQTGTSPESSQSELSPSPVEAAPPITPRLKRYFNE
jgi:putative transposase